jgi:hypothetical protein
LRRTEVETCGRPPALDDGKRREIQAILSVGGNQLTAARYVGCSVRTIQRTAERDPAFAAQLRQAICNNELGLLQDIRKAAKKEQYWRAAAWVLERGFPEKYARRGPDVITVNQIGTMLTRIADMVVQEVPEKYRKAIIKRMDALAQDLGCPPQRKPDDDPE